MLEVMSEGARELEAMEEMMRYSGVDHLGRGR
jgi:hypothetical protein